MFAPLREHVMQPECGQEMAVPYHPGIGAFGQRPGQGMSPQPGDGGHPGDAIDHLEGGDAFQPRAVRITRMQAIHHDVARDAFGEEWAVVEIRGRAIDQNQGVFEVMQFDVLHLAVAQGARSVEVDGEWRGSGHYFSFNYKNFSHNRNIWAKKSTVLL